MAIISMQRPKSYLMFELTVKLKKSGVNDIGCPRLPCGMRPFSLNVDTFETRHAETFRSPPNAFCNA